MSRQDWRLGGRAVSRWDAKVFLSGLLGVVVASFASIATMRATGFWGGLLAAPLLWVGLLSVCAFAFARARPAGLMRLQPRDLLYGLAFGILLRFAQAGLSGAQDAPFPSSYLLITGEFVRWFLAEALPLGIVGPGVEELFFRAVILVSVYQTLRRITGPASAAVAATLVSTGFFVAVHAVLAPTTLYGSFQFALLGLTCSALVFCTGRLWAAVVAHITYNCSFLLLVLAGSVLS